MKKPNLVLIHPAPDKDRLISRRRTKSSVAQLNLPILAAHADDRFVVRILDENVEEIDFGAVTADLVGISLMTSTALRGYEIADGFRGRGIPVVLGGMHVYFLQDEALAHADAIVIGEGEYAWNELLDDFLAGRLKRSYRAEKLHDLRGLPRPRLDLLKPGAYSFPNVVETSRGCPNRCNYCAVTEFWGTKFRFRPVEEVIDEIRALPAGNLLFIDDNMFGHSSRSKELFRALIPLKRRWVGQGDLKLARDPELLDLAARSGCKWLFMGFETTSEENLRALGKARLNRAHEYERSIAAIHRAGIKILGSFMFGLDNDGPDVFARTLDFCIENRLECANFYILTPLPGTKLFDDLREQGRIEHFDWSRYDANHVVIKPAGMSRKELTEGYIRTYRAFYSLRSIARRALSTRRDKVHTVIMNLGRKLNARYFEEGCRI
ncbi:MAG: Radical SAM superfamily protein [Syntrophaceae bacterium PtaB.Bin038]|nr:MAG: Radical SAM superfamily protein [Syntrophaceae bacterium PtaB.Bin038]